MAIIARTLSEQAYNLIRDRIVCGDLPCGEAIRQDALAKTLGVSKIPLREAFARLERDGLLTSITNRGFFVPVLSEDEAEEIYALRLKLEPSAVGMAAKKATAADRQTAKDALKALNELSTPDKAAAGRQHRAFHMSLVHPIRHPITIQIIERINVVAERYVIKHLEPSGRKNRAKKEHSAMLEAWLEGKTRQVESMMHAHIQSTLDDLRRQFELEGKGPA